MASIFFRFLNPFHWFRDREFDFIEQQSNYCYLVMRPTKGFSEKTMIKFLKKIFGKKLEYLKSPVKVAMGEEQFNDPEHWFRMELTGNFWENYKIYGKGVDRVAKALKDYIPGHHWGPENGFIVGEYKIKENDTDWISRSVCRAIVVYRDVTGVDIKELPAQCPYCRCLLTNHVDARGGVSKEELTQKKKEKVIADLAEEGIPEEDFEAVGIDESYFLVENNRTDLDSTGCCNNCDGMVLDLEDKQYLRLFKDIWKAQLENGLMIFNGFH